MNWPLRLARPLAVLALVVLAGCASAPKPTVVNVAVEATAGVNPDNKGRASPVVVRVFVLKNLAAFNGSDFFSLFDKDKETLGAELVDREELQLKPGDKRQVQKQPPPDGKFVGVVAAFRDLERAEWRAATPVTANQVNNLVVKVDGTKITIAAAK